MTAEMEKKLEALLQNEDEINTIFDGEPEQILANFAARGIEMSMEELGELSVGLLDGMQPSREGELSENELEDVAGGVIIVTAMVRIGVAFGQFTVGLKDGIQENSPRMSTVPYKVGYAIGRTYARKRSH